MGYNPHKKVLEFSEEHSKALDLLEVYNEVDPFHCYYGVELNPDEYLGYAKRLLHQLLDLQPIEDAVKMSFHPGQLEDGFLSLEDLKKIEEGVREVW